MKFKEKKKFCKGGQNGGSGGLTPTRRVAAGGRFSKGKLLWILECREDLGQLEFPKSEQKRARSARAKLKIAGKKVKKSISFKLSSRFLIVNNAQVFQVGENSLETLKIWLDGLTKNHDPTFSPKWRKS